MLDPFASALDTLFASTMAVPAIYQAPGGDPVAIRVIRSRATIEADGASVLVDTEQAEIRRSDVPLPVAGARISFEGSEDFTMQGGAQLDVEGLTWACHLEPAD